MRYSAKQLLCYCCQKRLKITCDVVLFQKVAGCRSVILLKMTTFSAIFSRILVTTTVQVDYRTAFVEHLFLQKIFLWLLPGNVMRKNSTAQQKTQVVLQRCYKVQTAKTISTKADFIVAVLWKYFKILLLFYI